MVPKEGLVLRKKIYNLLMAVSISFLTIFTMIEFIIWLIKSITSTNVYNIHMLLFIIGFFIGGLLISLNKKVELKNKD